MSPEAPAAFFSYSREDSEFALRLAEDLRDAGAIVWIDQLDMEPGRYWPRAAEEALARCPWMLLILSATSVQSRPVSNEIAYAIEEGKTIIPVLYKDCTIPLQLRGIHYIDFRSDYAPGLKMLLKTLGANQRPVREKAASEEQSPARQPSLVPDAGTANQLHVLAGHARTIRGIAVTGDGRGIVSASNDRTLKLWNLESGREVHTMHGHTSFVNGVAASGNGRLAVSASADCTLKTWDLETGEVLRTLEGHTGYVNGVALTSNGRIAVSASADGSLKVWELNSGGVLHTLQGHSSYVNAVALSPDGKLAVSASNDHVLKIWSIEEGHEITTLVGHSQSVNGIALSGDGRLAVSASADRTLKVWDLENGREVHTLEGHRSYVNGVAVSGDGWRAVSASDDCTLRVWDVMKGVELAAFELHNRLICCAISPDEASVFAGGVDAVIHHIRL